MSDVFNDGGLPHGAFTATLSNGFAYDFERFVPDHPTKTINQYAPDGTPKKSVDVLDFSTASATIQVDSSNVNGKPLNMPPLGVTMVVDTGYGEGAGLSTWRLKSINGPGFNMGEYWKFETTWQLNVNS